MKKLIRPTLMLLAVATGLGAFSMIASAATGVPICYRGRVITVASSVVARYLANGASLITDPCPNS